MRARDLLALLALHELAQERLLAPGIVSEPDTVTGSTFGAIMEELDHFDDDDQKIVDHYRQRLERELREEANAA